MRSTEPKPIFTEPDYEYGNRSRIKVVQIVPSLAGALDPHRSLQEYELKDQPPYTEAQIREKIAEIADNYKVVSDPDSPKTAPRQIGMTIVNKDLLLQGVPGLIIMTTAGSSFYDEEFNPNNGGIAVEIAYEALANPTKPIVAVESPGTGNSSDLTPDEYKQAMHDGKLVHEVRDHTGKIIEYDAFETVQGIARALGPEGEGVSISHASAKVSATLFTGALKAALPRDTMERSFDYNPTNISDRNVAALILANLWEIRSQNKYAESSHDPLKITEERKEMALGILSSAKKRKRDQIRAQTHNPFKMVRQQQVLSRGNKNGQAAAVHAVAAQQQHHDLLQTFAVPAFAAQYKHTERDIARFMKLIKVLGGSAAELASMQTLELPIGQYAHSYFPTMLATLQANAFNR
jgi:hypothetical protein